MASGAPTRPLPGRRPHVRAGLLRGLRAQRRPSGLPSGSTRLRSSQAPASSPIRCSPFRSVPACGDRWCRPTPPSHQDGNLQWTPRLGQSLPLAAVDASWNGPGSGRSPSAAAWSSLAAGGPARRRPAWRWRRRRRAAGGRRRRGGRGPPEPGAGFERRGRHTPLVGCRVWLSTRTVHRCTACGSAAPRWAGRCAGLRGMELPRRGDRAPRRPPSPRRGGARSRPGAAWPAKRGCPWR